MHKLLPFSRIGNFTFLSFVAGIFNFGINALLSLIQEPELTYAVTIVFVILYFIFFWLTNSLIEARYYVKELSRRSLLMSFTTILFLPGCFLMFWQRWEYSIPLSILLTVILSGMYFSLFVPAYIRRQKLMVLKRAARNAAHP